MRYPIGLVFDSAKYLARNRLRGERKFSVMLSLELHGSANGRPAGSNGQAATASLTVEQCLAAIEECPTPIVSISGDEPLDHPEIAVLTRAILERGRHLL